MSKKKLVNLTVDGREVAVPDGATILAAAEKLQIAIPTLCHHEKLKPAAACRLCHVEVSSGARREVLLPACATVVEEGMSVRTDTQKVVEARRFIFALLLARAPLPPKLVAMAREHGAVLAADATDPVCAFLHHCVEEKKQAVGLDNLTWCIACGQCVRVCEEVVQAKAIGSTYRGPTKRIDTPYHDISHNCIGCGSCAYVCPTGAITISAAE